MSRLTFLSLATALLVAGLARSVAADFFITPPPIAASNVSSTAGAFSGTFVDDEIDIPSFPFATTTQATASGDFATADWSLTHEGWRVDFEATNSAGPDAHSNSRLSVFFTVDEDVFVRFDGEYTVVGSSRNLLFRVLLLDRTAPQGEQTKYNEFYSGLSWLSGISVALGDSPPVEGSRFAVLVPGREYRLIMDASLSVNSNEIALGSATGSGFFEMTIPARAPALAPSSIAILCFVLAAAGWASFSAWRVARRAPRAQRH